jgi:hypothetical protein
MTDPCKPDASEYSIWDDWHFIALAIVAILIFVLEKLDLLDKLHIETTQIILLFLVAFAGVFYVHAKHQTKYNRYVLHEIENIQHFTEHLTRIEILKDREALFRTYNSLLTPGTRLYVTFFSPPPTENKMLTEETKYWETIRRYLSNFPSFGVLRMVTIEDQAKFDWVKKLLEQNKYHKNDSLKYRLAPRGHSRINVNIIDNGTRRYAIIHPSHGYVKDGTEYLFIDDDRVAGYYQNYFLLAWSECFFLKDGADSHFTVQEFKKIEAFLANPDT